MRFIFFVFFVISSCTCNWHLKRAKIKCGYTFTTDTVYKPVVITVPGIDTNGTKPANVNVDSLASIIQELFINNNSLKTKNDSLLLQALNKRLGNYIINRPCLTDTLSIAINGGIIKLWQAGGKFYWSVKIPPQVIERRVPVVVNTASVKESNPWYLWGIILFLSILLLLVLWKKSQK